MPGRSNPIDALKATFDVFDSVTIAPLVVRGERLFLCRLTSSREGFDVTSLNIIEFDAESSSSTPSRGVGIARIARFRWVCGVARRGLRQ